MLILNPLYCSWKPISSYTLRVPCCTLGTHVNTSPIPHLLLSSSREDWPLARETHAQEGPSPSACIPLPHPPWMRLAFISVPSPGLFLGTLRSRLYLSKSRLQFRSQFRIDCIGCKVNMKSNSFLLIRVCVFFPAGRRVCWWVWLYMLGHLNWLLNLYFSYPQV